MSNDMNGTKDDVMSEEGYKENCSSCADSVGNEQLRH
jgi:hypothetical protein